MSSLNISLPESLKAFVEDQVARGGYSTASEYVRALIRDEKKRLAQLKLEKLLLEGLESGNAGVMTAQDWDDIRQEVRRRFDERQSG